MSQKAIVAGVERHSIARPPNTVVCDVAGCGAELHVERYPRLGGSGPEAARLQAKDAGWGFVDGQDLCPKHLAELPGGPRRS